MINFLLGITKNTFMYLKNRVHKNSKNYIFFIKAGMYYNNLFDTGME